VARREQAWNHSLHRQENHHHWGAEQPPEWQNLCSNILWGEGEGFKGAEKPSPFLCHGFIGVSHQGVTSLHFCDEDVKTGAQVYQEDVLQGVVKPLNTAVFSGQKLVFQQDTAPAQNAKMAQEWLRRHFLAFISAENWPSGSPDPNPLDYKLWALLEDEACQKYHNNLDSLKRSLVKAVAEIPQETVCAAIAEWLESSQGLCWGRGRPFWVALL